MSTRGWGVRGDTGAVGSADRRLTQANREYPKNQADKSLPEPEGVNARFNEKRAEGETSEEGAGAEYKGDTGWEGKNKRGEEGRKCVRC